MRNSYVERIVKGYPNVKVPMTEEQVVQIGSVCEVFPREKFVAKSERIAFLEEELAIADALCEKADGVAKLWCGNVNGSGKDKHYPTFSYETPNFCKFYTDGVGAEVFRRIRTVSEPATNYVKTMQATATMLAETLRVTKDGLEQELEVEKKGVSGETVVENYLRRTLSCRILSSVVLPAAGENANGPKTAETDLLVISSSGVFVCEIKNYGKAGQTLEIRPNGQVIKSDCNGRTLESMGSPFMQNERHVRAVCKILVDVGLGHVPVYPVVIIANTDVNVVNGSDYLVTNMYQFQEMVARGYQDIQCAIDVQEKVFAAIQKERMGERRFPIAAVSTVELLYMSTMEQLTVAHMDHGKWVHETQTAFDAWIHGILAKWRHKNFRLVSLEKTLTFLDYIILFMGVGLPVLGFLAFLIMDGRVPNGFGSTVIPAMCLSGVIFFAAFIATHVCNDKDIGDYDYLKKGNNSICFFWKIMFTKVLPRYLLLFAPSVILLLDFSYPSLF